MEGFLAWPPPAASASLAYRLSYNATCSASVPRGRRGAYGRVVTLQEVEAGGDRAASGAGGAAGAISSRPISGPPHAVVVPPRFCMEDPYRQGSQRTRGVTLPGGFVLLSPVCFPFRAFPFSPWR